MNYERQQEGVSALGQNVVVGQPSRLGQTARFVQRRNSFPAFCGIDVALKKHNVAILDEQHRVVKKFLILNDKNGVDRLCTELTPRMLITMENTGPYTLALALALHTRGFDVGICDGRDAKSHREIEFKDKKNDWIDAIALATFRVVRRHKVTSVPEYVARFRSDSPIDGLYHLRKLVREYRASSAYLGRLKNRLTMIVDVRFPEAVKVFRRRRTGMTVRAALQMTRDQLLSTTAHLKKGDELHRELSNSIGSYDLFQKEFRELLAEIERIEAERKTMLSSIEESLRTEGFGQLLEYNGINAVNGAVFVTELGDIRRFYKHAPDGKLALKRTLKTFQEYCGLRVKMKQTGQNEGVHKLSSTGNMEIRSMLYLLAMCLISQKNYEAARAQTGPLCPGKYIALYERYTANPKVPKKVALIKVMSKIATDLFFVLKELHEQRAQRLAQSAASSPTPATA